MLQCTKCSRSIPLPQREVASCLEKIRGVLPFTLMKAEHSQSVGNRDRLNAYIYSSSLRLEHERFGLPQVTLEQCQAPRRFGHSKDLLFGIGATRYRFRSQSVPFRVRPLSAFPTQVAQQMETQPGVVHVAVCECLLGKPLQKLCSIFGVFRTLSA